MSTLKIRENSSSPWQSIPTGGVGVPAGGTTNQFLTKSSNVDYATQWSTVTPATIGAMAEWDLLWENASPTSSYAAHTESLDLSGYDAVAVLIGRNADPYPMKQFYLAPVGGAITAYTIWLGSYITPVSQRDINITSSGVTFADCSQKANLSNSTGPSTHNQDLIPIAIYGIKGVNNS